MKEMPINEEIRAEEVRLIDENGEMIGVVPIKTAKDKAYGKNLDLVLVNGNANPPVCKIFDYSKFRYQRIKKLKEERKRQTVIALKDIWLSATIDIGDLNTKAKKAREFIESGDKVRLSIRMRGRQLSHPEIAIDVMNTFFEKLSDIAEMEVKPNQQGRSVLMILEPISKSSKK